MKKNYFKKTVSLFLAIMMLMSCWVFVAPENADAANLTIYYPVTINFNVTTALSNGGNAYVEYYPVTDSGTLDTSSDVLKHYITESFSNSGTTAKADGYSLSTNVPGFPVNLVITVASDTWTNPALVLTSFYVGGINVINGWSGTVKEQTRNWAQSDGSMDSITWNWSNPSWYASTALGGTTLQVPSYGTRTSGTLSASFKDQYGVEWPQAQVKYSINGTGATLSSTTSSTTVSVTNAALANFTDATGTANLTLTATGGTATSTSTIKLNAPKKDVLFENLFSFSDWYYSDSSRWNDTSGNMAFDVDAGSVTINNPTTDSNSEYVTTSATGTHPDNYYAVDVTGGTTYYLSLIHI